MKHSWGIQVNSALFSALEIYVVVCGNLKQISFILLILFFLLNVYFVYIFYSSLHSFD